MHNGSSRGSREPGDRKRLERTGGRALIIDCSFNDKLLGASKERGQAFGFRQRTEIGYRHRDGACASQA